MDEDERVNRSRYALSQRTRLGSGLYGHVVNLLGQSIVDGKMLAGEVVFTDKLCHDLDVSRSVLREGLRTLGSMGMIEARPQVGTRVLPIDQWDLLNPQIVRWRAQSRYRDVQMREILEFRLGIEPIAAALASQRISRENVDALLLASETMTNAFESDDRYRFFGADAVFHRMILEGSGNAVIAQFADTVEATLHSRTDDARAANRELNAKSLHGHVELASAVQQSDSERSKQLALRIIEWTLQDFD